MASHVLDGGEVLTFRILNITTPTPTSTQSNPTVSKPPRIYPGHGKYQLLGCYKELAPIGVGTTSGTYGPYIINPTFGPNALTVPRCLETCTTARTLDGVIGYTYSAVEDGRKCYCGLTISNFTLSNASLNSLCSLPCPGDQSTSCGGDGYLALYEFNSTLNFIGNAPLGNTLSTNTIPSTSSIYLSASPTSNRNATLQTPPSHSDTANERIWLAVGISLGVSLIGVLLLFIIYFCASRRYPRKRNISTRSTEAGILNTTKESNGISSEEHFTSELKRGGTIKGTVVRGKFTTGSQVVLGENEEDKDELAHDSRVLEEALEAWKSGIIPAEEELLKMGQRNRTPTIVHPSEGIMESAINSRSITPPEAEDKGGGEKVQKRRSMLDWEESQKRSLWSETFFEREDGSFGRVM